MNAITPQRIGSPGHRGRRAVLGGMRRAPGAYSGRSVTQTPARASGGAPLRREDFAALVYVLETEGHFTPAPPDPLALCAPSVWADPRPDLGADHARWLTLLELADRRDGADPNGVFGALNGIRCCGAKIMSNGGAQPAWRLTRGEMTAAEWQSIRTKWLTPALALTRSAGASVPRLKVLQELLGAPATATTEAAQNL